MILTDQQIIESHRRGEIIIEPFDEKQVQGASYDLRLGEEGITTTSKRVVNIREHGYLTVEPGDFGVVTVFEILRVDSQHVGRFGLRSKFARKGLLAATGPQIDPGYHGRLMVGVVNLSPKPIVLPFKDDFLTVEFHRLNEASTKPYSGPYQERLTLGPEEIASIVESEGLAFSEVLTTLRAVSQNVAALTNQMKTFKWVIPLIVGFGIAVMAAISALKR